MTDKRDAAFWRRLCEELVFSSGREREKARDLALAELAKANVEALR